MFQNVVSSIFIKYIIKILVLCVLKRFCMFQSLDAVLFYIELCESVCVGVCVCVRERASRNEYLSGIQI